VTEYGVDEVVTELVVRHEAQLVELEGIEEHRGKQQEVAPLARGAPRRH
jgi:hypothetical protein